jgi:hypothetical protein
MTSPIYRSPEPYEEARFRLVSLLSVCEHELASREAIGGDKLTTIIQHMRSFREELVATLDTIPEPADSPA